MDTADALVETVKGMAHALTSGALTAVMIAGAVGLILVLLHAVGVGRTR